MLFYNKRCFRTDTDVRGSKQQRCFFATQKNSLSSHRHGCLWLDEDILTLFSSDSVFKMTASPLLHLSTTTASTWQHRASFYRWPSQRTTGCCCSLISSIRSASGILRCEAFSLKTWSFTFPRWKHPRCSACLDFHVRICTSTIAESWNPCTETDHYESQCSMQNELIQLTSLPPKNWPGCQSLDARFGISATKSERTQQKWCLTKISFL